MITSSSLLDVGQHGERTLRHLVLARLRVDLAKQTPFAVEALQRLGLAAIDLDPPANGELVVVGATLELEAAYIADPFLHRGFELEVVGALAVRTRPARRETPDGHLVGDRELEDGRERPLRRGERIVERLRLRHGAREAVEDEAL